jgi:hypothetical protein
MMAYLTEEAEGKAKNAMFIVSHEHLIDLEATIQDFRRAEAQAHKAAQSISAARDKAARHASLQARPRGQRPPAHTAVAWNKQAVAYVVQMLRMSDLERQPDDTAAKRRLQPVHMQLSEVCGRRPEMERDSHTCVTSLASRSRCAFWYQALLASVSLKACTFVHAAIQDVAA